MKVYVPDNRPEVVLFDTESKKGQILIEDKNSVFFVMQTSLTQEWAVVSRMPADPEDARGASEEKLLFYIPQKRLVYNPQYGKNAYLIAIEADGENEQVQWIIDDDKTVSVSLKELKEVCIKDTQACTATPA
ncbi:MAG: hypothetical protein GX640_21170, partial [Fibrobacter sp.]|nr:hypothetical protein [Fibrobacter sp.]